LQFDIARAKLPTSKWMSELIFGKTKIGFAEIAKSGGFGHH
jgi:hypothetical protein